MCGRFTLHTPEAEILQAFDIASASVALLPRYNITPSQDIPVVRASDEGRELRMARWGLVPGWSKEARPKYSTINARLESAAEKPTYRGAFRHKRCLIPADGFYEWQREGDKKTPYHIRLQDQTVFAFAGLWEHWEGDDESFDSCAIITMPASGVMQTVHTRMPALIAADGYDAWLDKGITHTADIMPQLASTLSGQLQAYPVSSYVNSPKHTDARCIEPL
ncbi:MAG: SOS response-associated peptidase [Gammaproteobacteria bacterium]